MVPFILFFMFDFLVFFRLFFGRHCTIQRSTGLLECKIKGIGLIGTVSARTLVLCSSYQGSSNYTVQQCFLGRCNAYHCVYVVTCLGEARRLYTNTCRRIVSCYEVSFANVLTNATRHCSLVRHCVVTCLHNFSCCGSHTIIGGGTSTSFDHKVGLCPYLFNDSLEGVSTRGFRVIVPAPMDSSVRSSNLGPQMRGRCLCNQNYHQITILGQLCVFLWTIGRLGASHGGVGPPRGGVVLQEHRCTIPLHFVARCPWHKGHTGVLFFPSPTRKHASQRTTLETFRREYPLSRGHMESLLFPVGTFLRLGVLCRVFHILRRLF